MGTYQAYVCMAITLSLLLVVKDMLNKSVSFGKAVVNGFRFVLYLGGGAVLYYIILKIFLKIKDLQLLSYLGMNAVEEGYPLDMLGSTILTTYKQVKDFFLVPGAENAFVNGWLVFLHVCILLTAAVFLLQWLHRNKLWKEVLRLAGVVVLLLLLPLAVNFAQIISPYSTATPIMKYAYVFVYFLAIWWADMFSRMESEQEAFATEEYAGRKIAGEHTGRQSKSSVSPKPFTVVGKCWKSLQIKIPSTLLVVSLVLTIGYFWKYDNLLYSILNQAHRATESFVTNVVSRIESCEGYQMGMKVVVVGGFPADRYYADVENYAKLEQNGVLGTSVIPLNKHIYYYMNDWLNIPIPEPTEEDFLRIAETAEFQAMPLYPNDGSVQIIGDCVVVKMQETFTPKAQYEKDYENRR